MFFLHFMVALASGLAGSATAQDGPQPDPQAHWEYFKLEQPPTMGFYDSSTELQSTAPCGGFDIDNRTYVTKWYSAKEGLFGNVHTFYCGEGHECHVVIEWARLNDTDHWTELKTLNMTNQFQFVEYTDLAKQLKRSDEIVVRARHVMSDLYTFFQCAAVKICDRLVTGELNCNNL